jgi:hypothetical protein
MEAIIPRTYKIKPGPPLGSSYARGIASRYGISYGQLEEKWKVKRRANGD